MIIRKPFYYLRHGQTNYNRRRRYQGSLDIPLNDTGIRQAFSAAETLRQRDFDAIYTSPLSRARQTAGIVAEAKGLPVTEIPALQEMDFGDLEGAQIIDKTLGEDWKAGEFTPKNGESYTVFAGRVLDGLADVLARDGTPLVVAHGGVFWPISEELGLEPVTPANAEPVLLRPTESGWTMEII